MNGDDLAQGVAHDANVGPRANPAALAVPDAARLLLPRVAIYVVSDLAFILNSARLFLRCQRLVMRGGCSMSRNDSCAWERACVGRAPGFAEVCADTCAITPDGMRCASR